MEPKIRKLSTPVPLDTHPSKKVERNHSAPRKECKTSADPFLKSYTFRKYETGARKNPGVFLWGDSFRPYNPIHTLMGIEAEKVSLPQTQKAYQMLEKILGRVKEKTSQVCLSPQDKLALVYDTMKEVGIQFGDMDESLLTRNLLQKKLDCDTSSFVVTAIAHEMGWPVYLVKVPNHIFVRWDDGKGIRFNMDFGEIYPDEYYVKKFEVPLETIRNGNHLKNLSPAQSMAIFLHNRANEFADRGDLIRGIQDNSEAIFLDPCYADAYLDRGNMRNELGHYLKAREDLRFAGKLDPRFSGADRNVEYTQMLRKALNR